MKTHTKTIRLLYLCILLVILFSCKKENVISDFEYGSLTDIEGNSYRTIKIGEQIWMAENLRVTKYNDGTSIPDVVNDSIWMQLNSPAFSWHNNDPNYKKLGALYNWYAANSNICPEGWHVSTDEDWKILEKYMGMPEEELNIFGNRGSNQGELLKSRTRWIAVKEGYPENGTNRYGLNIYPMSSRSGFGGFFYGFRASNNYWSPLESDTSIYCYRFFLPTSTKLVDMIKKTAYSGVVMQIMVFVYAV